MTADIEVYEPQTQPPATLFGTDSPDEVVARATAAARPLAKVVEEQKLFSNISGNKHVLVEGWTLLGSMLGVFPVTVWSRKTDTGWEARVEARTKHGEVVGAAEASCDREERNWRSRDDFALRSMAQTRATSKALRQPLGFVMTLAGYSATPAEEMPRESIQDAEVVTDPEGRVFPDQRDVSQFQPPTGPRPVAKAKRGTVSDAQLKNIRRLVTKLAGLGQSEDTLRDSLELQYGTRHFSELEKGDASKVIAALMGMAGEEK